MFWVRVDRGGYGFCFGVVYIWLRWRIVGILFFERDVERVFWGGGFLLRF